ncbi:MAG TPA: DUF6265 family protein [Bacteroidales bacterium]|nr:DUF6265 family protein [Bacteroidales bacterium]HRZ76525.1 DUF6265 family protein [Bacteroidales bacterium]
MKIFGTLLAFLLLLQGAAAQEGKAGLPLWLEGSWQAETDSAVHETWEITVTGLLQGYGWRSEDGDTVVSERLQLEANGQQLKYMATVKGQNQGQAITFLGLAFSDSAFLVENPAHDFPQSISYTLLRDGSMVTSLGGAEKTCTSSLWIRLLQNIDIQSLNNNWKP